MLTVSVVVLNWNGKHLLERCLPSVVQHSGEAEIVLADNASGDDSVEWVEAHYPSVRIVRHPENWGFCRGNNEAVRQTETDLVLLLNNDVEVLPGWLDPLVREMERDASVAAVQPKLLDAVVNSRFEYAGASGGHMDRLGYTFARGRLFETVEDDSGQYNDDQDVFWATGAAILMRRSALEVTGLLDERFEFHMEEIDLCWRMLRAGFKVRVVPESTVFHLGGSSLPRGSARKTFYNYRNSLLMLHKNLPVEHRSKMMFERFLYDLTSLIRSAVTLNWSDVGAITRAYRDYRRLRDDDPTPPIDQRSILPSYQGSVVVDYFLRGRRRFSDLPADRFTFGR